MKCLALVSREEQKMVNRIHFMRPFMLERNLGAKKDTTLRSDMRYIVEGKHLRGKWRGRAAVQRCGVTCGRHPSSGSE